MSFSSTSEEEVKIEKEKPIVLAGDTNPFQIAVKRRGTLLTKGIEKVNIQNLVQETPLLQLNREKPGVSKG